jgi:hypothetical protein
MSSPSLRAPKRLTLIALVIVSSAVAACSSGGGTTGTGGKVGGTGGAKATGGATGTGGGNIGIGSGGGAVIGSGGSGTGGSNGSGGDLGIGGDTGSSGGAGGMSFLLTCGIQMAVNSVYPASAASNAPLITDFTYSPGSSPNSTFFGDTYNQVTGLSYHFPDRPVDSSGGAGGDASGAGGVGGGAAGGRGGAGGRGAAGRGGVGGRGGAGAGGRGGAGGFAPVLGPIGLTEDLTASDWHITGVVGGQATAFVLQFTCTIDASAYSGIQFTIKGNAGAPGRLSLQLAFAGDETGSYVTPGYGLCSGTCQAPTTSITVTPTVTTIQIPWSRFTGGRPIASVNPAQLVRLLWAFTTSATPYPIDVTIDDLIFFTAPTPVVDAGASD